MENTNNINDDSFKILFEQAPLGYQSLDFDGNFIVVNQKWLDTFGYERNEVVGKWFGDFLAPGYKEAFAKNFPMFKAQGHIHVEFEMLHKNGNILFIAFEGKIGYDEVGNFKQTHCILEDITEKKLSEDKLRETLAMLRTTFDQSPIGSVVVLLDKRFHKCNAAFCRFIGYSESELIGKTIAEITHPEDVNLGMNELKLMAEGKLNLATVEKRYVRKDGSIVWGEVNISAVRDTNNKPVCFLPVIQDITERKQVEKALKESEERFKNMFEHHSSIMLLLEVESGMILDANEASEMFYGYSKAELLTKRIDEINVLSPEQVKMEREQAFREERNYFVFPHRLATGEVRIVEVHSSPIVFHDQRVLFSIIHDITERKQAEKAMQESKDFLDKIINSIASPIFVKDDKLKFCLVNKALCTLLNLPAEELIGNTGYENFPEEQNEVFLAKDMEVLSSGKENISEEFLTDGNGNIRTIVTKKTLYTDLEGNKFIVGVINDITERKQNEEKLIKTEEALRNTNENLVAALSNMSDAVFISNEKGKFIEFNEAFATFHKFKKKSDCPENLSDWISVVEVYTMDGKLVPIEEWAVPRALKGEIGLNEEFRLRRKDTGETWIGSYNFSPIRNKSGDIVGSVTVGRDITERKLTEEVAKREQTLSKAIIESIPGTFYMLDETGKYVRWNAYQRDEIVGKPNSLVSSTNAMETIHPDDRGFVQLKIANVLKNGKDETVEGRVLLRGGPAFRWLVMTGCRMLIDGRPFLVGIGIDITELKETEIALKSKIDELNQMNSLMVGRELKMIELKKEVNELLKEAKKQEKYEV